MRKLKLRAPGIAGAFVAGLAVMAVFTIAMPASGSPTGAVAAKKKTKRGPRGPRGARGPSGIAVRGFTASTTAIGDFTIPDGDCAHLTFNAPGVRPGQVVAVNLAATNPATTNFSIDPAAPTIPANDRLNLLFCNHSGTGSPSFPVDGIGIGYVAF